MKKIVFAGLLFISGAIMTSAQIKLSFTPEKGKKYEYQQEMTQKNVSNVMGQEFPMETAMNITYLIEIKDKTSQEVQVQFTYKRLSYNILSPMTTMRYDSQSRIENPSSMDSMLEKMLSRLINQSVMVAITSDGSVKSVTGMDAIAEGMSNMYTGDPMVDPMVEQLKQQFTGAAFKNSFEQMFGFYPANPVKAGDSWNTTPAMSVDNMDINVKTKYTLKDVSRNMATIAEESDITMKASVNLEGKLTGTQSGTLLVDTQTGMPVSSETSQKISGILTAQGFDVQTDISTRVKTSTTEVN